MIVEVGKSKICRARLPGWRPREESVLQVKSEAICWQNYLSL